MTSLFQSRCPHPILALFVLLSLLATGCSDDKKPETPEQARQRVISEVQEKLGEAGQNPVKLATVETWIDGKIKSETDETLKSSLGNQRTRCRDLIGDSFLALSHETAVGNDFAKVKTVLQWADARLDAENAIPEGERDGLAMKLAKGRRELQLALLQQNPDDQKLRESLGYIAVSLDEKVAEDDHFAYNKALQKDISEFAVKLQRMSDKTSDGKVWLSPDSPEAARYRRIVEAMDAERKAHETRMADPFQKLALEAGKQAGADVVKVLENTAYRWVIYAEKPYVLIIERDEQWNEVNVAKEEIAKLMELYNHFYGEYRDVLGLVDITDPVPVVMFKRANAYGQLAKKSNVGSGAAGHFDGSTGRLYVSNETGSDTLIHEGTHQLVAYNTQGRNFAGFRDRSYWFGEGVAEFFGGSHRYQDKDTKEWRWELGVLQTGRIDYWRQNQHKAYKLWDLINLTIRDREANKAKGEEDLNLFVYSQGWFLVYFLNNFAVDSKGMVQVGGEGKYRKNWLQYFRKELEGGGGRDDFLTCLGLWKDGKLDQPAWDKFEEEFNAYWEFVNRKVAMAAAGHMKERKLIPWDKAVNKRGDKTGEEVDDLLYVPGEK